MFLIAHTHAENSLYRVPVNVSLISLYFYFILSDSFIIFEGICYNGSQMECPFIYMLVYKTHLFIRNIKPLGWPFINNFNCICTCHN